MPKSSHALLDAEVKRPHRAEGERDEAVKNLHPALRMAKAKAKAGAAIEHAIGDTPDKHFGHEGLMSALKSGEKIPDYLARIVEDDDARLRFAKALLQGDTRVTFRTVIEIDERKVG